MSESHVARDRELLLLWSRSRTLPARVVQRSRILLMLADGHRVSEVASALKVSASTVRLWRQRFEQSGPDSLRNDAAGRGRKPVLDATTREALRNGQRDGDPMSVRERARELGVSAATVSRWRRRRPEST